MELAGVDALLRDWRAATAPVDVRASLGASGTLCSSSEGSRGALARSGAREAPLSCRPFDHAAFLDRVDSFRIAWWFGKPRLISAFASARHGWRNAAPDLLHCDSCDKMLSFAIDARLSDAGAEKLAKVFAEQLVTGHEELCPWRGNPSPIDFLTLPIGTEQTVWEACEKRLRGDVEWAIAHPSWTQRIMDEFQISEGVEEKLVNAICSARGNVGDHDAESIGERLATKLKLTKPDGSIIGGRIIGVLSLLITSGWQFDGEEREIVWCSSCNRRWALLHDEKVGNAETDGPPRKRVKTESPEAIDLLAQHRLFCPCVREQETFEANEENQTVYDEYSRQPGWLQYCQAISNYLDEKETVASPTSLDVPHRDPARNPEEYLKSISSILDL